MDSNVSSVRQSILSYQSNSGPAKIKKRGTYKGCSVVQPGAPHKARSLVGCSGTSSAGKMSKPKKSTGKRKTEKKESKEEAKQKKSKTYKSFVENVFKRNKEEKYQDYMARLRQIGKIAEIEEMIAQEMLEERSRDSLESLQNLAERIGKMLECPPEIAEQHNILKCYGEITKEDLKALQEQRKRAEERVEAIDKNDSSSDAIEKRRLLEEKIQMLDKAIAHLEESLSHSDSVLQQLETKFGERIADGYTFNSKLGEAMPNDPSAGTKTQAELSHILLDELVPCGENKEQMVEIVFSKFVPPQDDDEIVAGRSSEEYIQCFDHNIRILADALQEPQKEAWFTASTLLKSLQATKTIYLQLLQLNESVQ